MKLFFGETFAKFVGAMRKKWEMPIWRFATVGALVLTVMGGFAWQVFLWHEQGSDSISAAVSRRPLEYIHPPSVFDHDGFVAGEKESRAKPPFTFTQPIQGGLIPHHALPSTLLSGFFRELAKQHPKTILLIGPNHPDAGQKKLLTSAAPWETPFGRVAGNGSKVEMLLGLPFAGVDEAVLSREHSVAGVLPFLHYFLPEAQVVPVVLNSHLSWSEIQAVSAALSAMADADTVILAAVDFSHFLPARVAAEKDQETELLLRNFRSQDLLPLGNDHVDSPISVAVLLETMKAMGATDFQLLTNTNSGRLLSDERSGTTSYFFAGFSREEETQVAAEGSKKVRLLFGGDMMFDRWIRTMMRRQGDAWPLEALRHVFREADAVIANLEGPITAHASVSEESQMGTRDNYVFTFDEAVAPLLKSFGFIANLGNNHILNFQSEGVSATERALRDADVGFFGSPLGESNRFLVKSFDGFRVAFVNYNQFVFQGEQKALEDMRAAADQADFIVLYAHWGDEYEPVTDNQKVLARKFVDAGADIVIGSHPHIVQEHEVYQDKTIYYSLGNLVFDQYFRDETQEGLLLSVSVDSRTGLYETLEQPVLMKTDGQTRMK